MLPRLERPPGLVDSNAATSTAGRSSAKTVATGGGSGTDSAEPISIMFWLGLMPSEEMSASSFKNAALDAHNLLPLRRHLRQGEELRLEELDRRRRVEVHLEFLLAPFDVDLDGGHESCGAGFFLDLLAPKRLRAGKAVETSAKNDRRRSRKIEAIV